MKLVVVQEFAPYKRGDEITDAASIEKVLSSPNVSKVVKVGPLNTPLEP